MTASPEPRVHLFAGLNGAGKSTLARQLERTLPAVRFGLDEWVLLLWSLDFDHPDYPAAAERCRSLIWDTAVQVLRAGSPVLLDWNLWSRARRAEWVDRAASVGERCVLHHLDVPVGVAIRRASTREDATSHALDAAAVRHLASIFEPPTLDEGLVVRVHPA